MTKSNFGPLIAYLIPGVTALWGLRPYVSAVRVLFAPAEGAVPTLGGFLYLTVAAVAMGMTVSAVRWVTIDTFHRFTGIRSPPFDFAMLGENVAAFEMLNYIHYQHYLFYANSALAIAVAYVGQRLPSAFPFQLGWEDVGFIALEVIFMLASRDTLRKYYERSARLLGVRR